MQGSLYGGSCFTRLTTIKSEAQDFRLTPLALYSRPVLMDRVGELDRYEAYERGSRCPAVRLRKSFWTVKKKVFLVCSNVTAFGAEMCLKTGHYITITKLRQHSYN